MAVANTSPVNETLRSPPSQESRPRRIRGLERGLGGREIARTHRPARLRARPRTLQRSSGQHNHTSASEADYCVPSEPEALVALTPLPPSALPGGLAGRRDVSADRSPACRTNIARPVPGSRPSVATGNGCARWQRTVFRMLVGLLPHGPRSDRTVDSVVTRSAVRRHASR